VESYYSNEATYTVPVPPPVVQALLAPPLRFSLSASSAAVTIAPPSVRARIRATPTKQLILTVTGPVGQTYNILATDDLQTWTIIGTVTIGSSGSTDFTDTAPATSPSCFYCVPG
jgi:hypothetical protein